jgi:hypothetical protein
MEGKIVAKETVSPRGEMSNLRSVGAYSEGYPRSLIYDFKINLRSFFKPTEHPSHSVLDKQNELPSRGDLSGTDNIYNTIPY